MSNVARSGTKEALGDRGRSAGVARVTKGDTASGQGEQARERLFLPFGAYQRDRLRANRDTPFTRHDGMWLVVASFLDNLGLVPEGRRARVLLNHERALAEALGPEVAEVPADHPFHWASRLRVALTADPVHADHDVVVRTVQRMAAAMASVGAVDLAMVTLQAGHRAFPRTSAEVDARVLLQRAGLAARLGEGGEARRLLTSARVVAKRAGLSALLAECDEERRRLPRQRSSRAVAAAPEASRQAVRVPAARRAKPKRR